MPTAIDHRPRILITLLDDNKMSADDKMAKLQHLIVRGTRNPIFNVIITDLIDILEGPDRDKFIGAVLGRHIKLEEWADVGVSDDKSK